jgi:O-antigen/teichoic acid export membrane protein
MTGDLDTLLAQPLRDVADGGFSAAVARRALALETRRKLLDQLVLLITVTIILLALPLVSLGAAIERVTFDLGNSAPIGVAFAALVLSALFMQRVDDRVE